MTSIFPKDKLAGSKIGHDIVASMVQPKTFQVDGDLGTDEITISYAGVDPTELTDAYDSEGEILKFTKTKPQITFYANARIQIDKPTTTNDVGLMLV